MRWPTRPAGSAGGFVASEFVLGVCVILVPVTLIVLVLPTWSERQAMAQQAANESARGRHRQLMERRRRRRHADGRPGGCQLRRLGGRGARA